MTYYRVIQVEEAPTELLAVIPAPWSIQSIAMILVVYNGVQYE